jgi:hypothetical protein
MNEDYRILILMLVPGVLPTVAQAAGLCFERPDSKYQPRGSYSWRWQLLDVDARKCWYFANRVLPKKQLSWPKGNPPQLTVGPKPEPSPSPSAERAPERQPWVLEYRWF